MLIYKIVIKVFDDVFHCDRDNLLITKKTLRGCCRNPPNMLDHLHRTWTESLTKQPTPPLLQFFFCFEKPPFTTSTFFFFLSEKPSSLTSTFHSERKTITSHNMPNSRENNAIVLIKQYNYLLLFFKKNILFFNNLIWYSEKSGKCCK